MSAALVSAIRDLGGMCKGLSNSGTVDYQQVLALERQIQNHLGQCKMVPSMVNITAAMARSKHHALAHSNSVSVPVPCPKNSHRKLDRSVSEPVERPLQQQPRPVQTNSSRYKTELCRPFEESGTCKYGDKCQFAHGISELRNLVRHPKYKTELCRTFHSTGFCPYGPRCHFIHNDMGKVVLGNLSPTNSIPISTDPERHSSVDFDVSGFSFGSGGELSPNSSSSMSGSPSSSTGGFYGDETTSSFSPPVPQTAPPFLTNPGFFDQDFVPFTNNAMPNAQTLPEVPYLNGGSVSPVDVLSASLDNLNLCCDMPASSQALDANRNVRLPIFNQLAFLGLGPD